jgi:molybdopterin/thiamine biosynthesis adenylyltransferase
VAPKRDESEIYDRQIRLWGAEAQAKMSKTKVLYIHVTGVSSEVQKSRFGWNSSRLCDNRTHL